MSSAQPSCTVGRRLVFVMWLHTWHHDFYGTLVLSQLHRVLGISRPWESEKVQDVEDFCDPLLLECSSGWVLFWLAQFYIGVFLHYHGTIEVLLCLACYRKRHLMDWSVLNLRALIIRRVPTSLQGCCFFVPAQSAMFTVNALQCLCSVTWIGKLFLPVLMVAPKCRRLLAGTAIEMLTWSFSFILSLCLFTIVSALRWELTEPGKIKNPSCKLYCVLKLPKRANVKPYSIFRMHMLRHTCIHHSHPDNLWL